jgi:protein-tyrosine phosphatase
LTLATWEVLGWLASLFLSAALSFFLLAAAYAGAGPRLLLKRPSGRRSAGVWALFAPYFLLNALSFALYRCVSRELAYAQAAPNVFFGRWLSRRECASAPWASVLDLAAELAESPPFQELAGYRSLPVLDATAPTEEQLRSAVTWVVAAVSSGPVYIHCALGHGRSACVVIAYLLAVGEVRTVAEGARRLRLLRPGVRLSPAQRKQLRRFEAQHQDTPNKLLPRTVGP